MTRAFRLVTYNVHACLGLDRRRSPQRIAQVLAGCAPDIVALQEVDVHRRRSRFSHQAQEIADGLQMHCHFESSLDLAEGQYGNAILSRFPLKLVRYARLPKPRGFPVESRGALWVTFDDLPLQLINTHLGLLPFERVRQLKELLSWLPAGPGPYVVCGDFNCLPGSREHRLLERQLKDAVTGRRLPTFWLWRLDHVFYSSELQVRDCSVPFSRLSRLASDHLPLVVDFQLER